MKRIFGVNSVIPSNTRLTNGYTMYDWVMRQKCFPAFWGRTLIGENPITVEEIDFLRKKDCRIVLVIRDLSEISVSAVNGTEDAKRAVEAATALGVPQNAGIALFAEIQPQWSINHNWMISFAREVHANGYLPGFIGNTDSSKNFNFDRQCSHYVQATERVKQYEAIYCATEPKQYEMPGEWKPYCPSALKQEDIHLWECGDIQFGELKAEVTYAHDKNVLNCMW